MTAALIDHLRRAHRMDGAKLQARSIVRTVAALGKVAERRCSWRILLLPMAGDSVVLLPSWP